MSIKILVISFFNRANPLSRICLFCNFVRNRIYVLECELFEPVSMARYSKKETGYNFCDIISLYNSCGDSVINMVG
jgi:hypothetical protein